MMQELYLPDFMDSKNLGQLSQIVTNFVFWFSKNFSSICITNIKIESWKFNNIYFFEW